MGNVLEVDYLVVGAGLAGMAITDELLTHSDATVAIVDRRHAPGGHWIDAYPFVRLHQPSVFYGVSSVPLGQDSIDKSGFNAGMYELAGADELRAYFAQVMRQAFLPSGRVHHFPCSEYGGGDGERHAFTSRLSGERRDVRVRRKLVDTRYLEGRIPATAPLPFELDEGVRWCAAGDVTRLAHAARRFAVIGGGKTATDTCVWLLEQGIAPDAIRWIKPREGWWLNRRYHQPLERLPDFCAGVGLQLQAFAEADSVDDVLLRLEAQGFVLRVDTAMLPTMLHGAILGEAELEQLRRIKDVVRLGHVRRLARGSIVLEHGEVGTDADTLHIHCAAQGLARPPLRPIFEPGRLTPQPTEWGFASFQFAMLGVVEAMVERDDDKNRLCPPIHYWHAPADYLRAYLALLGAERSRASVPELAAWAKQTRLNPLGRLGEYREHPTAVAARGQIRQFGPAAAQALTRLLSGERPEVA